MAARAETVCGLADELHDPFKSAQKNGIAHDRLQGLSRSERIRFRNKIGQLPECHPRIMAAHRWSAFHEGR